MDNTILFRALVLAEPRPMLGTIARCGIRMQQWCWQKKPELTERLSNFLPIGGSCILVQFVIFTMTRIWGVELTRANILSTEVAVFMSFVLNRQITWKDRLPPTSRWWHVVFQFIAFNVLLPMPWIMILGYGSLVQHLGLPWLLTWALAQIIVVAVNFAIGDRIIFGLLPKLMQRL